MAFALQPNPHMQPEVRRAATACLDRAIKRLEGLEGLEDKSPREIEDAIHNVRKRCKEVRALARLVRKPLESEWRPFNRLVRDAANELSSIRDTHALATTLDVLLTVHHSGSDASLEAVRDAQDRAASNATAGIRDGDPRLERAHGLLLAAREGVEHWEIEAGSAWLVTGVHDSYRGGRRALRRARRQPTDERLHEWRKHVKTLWYQMRLVEAAAPSIVGPLAGTLHDLADALGDDHDLAVLVDRLEADRSRFGGKKAARSAVLLARSQQEELRRRAFRLGETLYAEKTAAFVSRIERYWQTTLNSGPELTTGGIAALVANKDDSAQREPTPTRSIEMERKFLVDLLPKTLEKGTQFRQGYLAIDGSVSVRIRNAGPEHCTVTIKAGRGAIRSELEWPITSAQFDSLWPLTIDRRIEKVRHRLTIGEDPDRATSHLAEIDCFQGDLEGLMLVEVEFESEHSMLAFSPPDWFGNEVTEDVTYTNASLSTLTAVP